MRWINLSLFCAVLLASCAPETSPHKVQAFEEGCDAASFERYLWQKEAVLAGVTLPKPTRIIHPGQPVTKDYRPNRLNIHVGELGRIERINCG